MLSRLFFLGCLIIGLAGCENGYKTEKHLFSIVPSSKSGIVFSNTISENDSINVLDFQYCYNGGGVGVGDFNNDGLQDLVFSGNQVSSALYLNKGGMQFEDATTASGLHTTSWVTGVSIIDINNDGLQDIYLCVGGPNCNNDCPNLLYVNQGLKDEIPFFKEEATAYGLDDGNYTQQALFFDYDLDGDLDAYLLHNGNTSFDKNNPLPKNYLPGHLKDNFLRNDSKEGNEHPIFKSISEEVGIVHPGFGLGIGISDFNDDGWPDIYVANDFITDDLLYINKGIDTETNKHLGFQESSKVYMQHTTYNSMGMDIADINGDLEPDVLVLDMLPLDYKRQKKMLGLSSYDKYLLSQENGYTSQYMRNTLQLGNGARDTMVFKASEVGFLSGISSTDWSWTPLMVDFDNDTDKDIFITNGYVKDITDLDFINFSKQNNLFGTPETRNNQVKQFVKELPGIHMPNFFYENTGLTQFRDVSKKWVKSTPSYSNGAAYADLDLDGDLDLIVNNINDEAFVLENQTSKNPTKQYLRVNLQGAKGNANAIGSKVTLWNNGKPQSQYQTTVRGYLSSVDPIVHFGVNDSIIDSLNITWPDGKISSLKNITANQVIESNWKNAQSITRQKIDDRTLFKVRDSLLDYVHKENRSNDFVYQHLLVRQYSKSGPCLAAANIDDIEGDEIFIGGSVGRPGQIWMQDDSGEYVIKQELDSIYEDTDAVFIDVDNDGDLDLYVASGGNEFAMGSVEYQDRIYLNDGNGIFAHDKNVLQESLISTGCIRPSDIDKDGDIDFFVGARITPRNYPTIPESHILINKKGKFVKKTIEVISNVGMVTDAVWQDIDKDGWKDLLVVGEWMPLTIFKNDKGQLKQNSSTWVDEYDNVLSTEGWWNTIESGDFDNDGDIDFVAGNQGLNGFVVPKTNEPLYVYKQDFDGNGSPDPILGQYFETQNGSELLPVHTRDDVMAQLSVLKNKYLTYESFAQVDFKELLEIKNLDKETLKASTFASSYIENLGEGKFKIIPLPDVCQVSAINDILVDDFNTDGFLDALLVGNDFTGESHYGRQDALTGIFLKGKGNGEFEPIKSKTSGFYVPEQSRHIINLIDKTGGKIILATQNNGVLKAFDFLK